MQSHQIYEKIRIHQVTRTPSSTFLITVCLHVGRSAVLTISCPCAAVLLTLLAGTITQSVHIHNLSIAHFLQEHIMM